MTEMIKKILIQIDDKEIELTPEQCQRLCDELLRLYPGGGGGGAPIQPLMPPLWPYSPFVPSPYDGAPVITCGGTACNFRDTSVWQ